MLGPPICRSMKSRGYRLLIQCMIADTTNWCFVCKQEQGSNEVSGLTGRAAAIIMVVSLLWFRFSSILARYFASSYIVPTTVPDEMPPSNQNNNERRVIMLQEGTSSSIGCRKDNLSRPSAGNSGCWLCLSSIIFHCSFIGIFSGIKQFSWAVCPFL